MLWFTCASAPSSVAAGSTSRPLCFAAAEHASARGRSVVRSIVLSVAVDGKEMKVAAFEGFE